MIYICKPKKIGIYINTRQLTIEQIKAVTGATAIINGGLFNSKFKPVCHLKVDGTVLAKDEYSYWGYGWNDNDIRLTQTYGTLENYICCCCLVKNGKAEKLYYNADMGGARQRTAIGLFPDGRLWMYASGNKMTPEALQTLCINAGLDSAIMLDGGGSTQGISPSGSYKQPRICHNYILVWEEYVCPYKEPTANVRWGSIGQNAKWVQWMLNRYGYQLSVDGIFLTQSVNAAKDFQRMNYLTVDGIVGKQTREALKA